MNSFPTPLNPWFAVILEKEERQFYTSQLDDDEPWTTDQKKAMLFLNLNSAIRVAKAFSAEILVLWDKAQLIEYGREVVGR